jgi:hypothetical protein
MKTDTSKSTILVISMGFLFLYIVFLWQWAIIVSFVIGVAGALSSFLSQKIEWIWMKIAQLLGKLIPNVILSIVFFLILFPISLLSKLFNKDPLMLSDKFNTYFIDLRDKKDKNSFKKIW